MANSYKSKYGTVINTAGLTPDQAKKVIGLADSKYGTKAAVLANQFRKRSGMVKGKAGTSLANDKTGAVNSNALIDKMAIDPNFAANQGKLAQDAAYKAASQNFARDKARDLESAKTELDNRGIPINPADESLWGKTVGGITEDYSNRDLQAHNQAVLTGAQTAGVYGNLDLSAKNAFLNTVLGAGAQNAGVYGVNKDYAAKMAQIKAAARKNSSGATTPDTGVILGGAASGFGV